MTTPLKYNGVLVTSQQLEQADARGLSRRVVYDRLKRGWSVEEAIAKPKIVDRSARSRRAAKKSPWRHGYANWHPK